MYTAFQRARDKLRQHVVFVERGKNVSRNTDSGVVLVLKLQDVFIAEVLSTILTSVMDTIKKQFLNYLQNYFVEVLGAKCCRSFTILKVTLRCTSFS